MNVNLSKNLTNIPYHQPKIISSNSIDKVKPNTLELDLKQALEQKLDQNLRICSLRNIESNKSQAQLSWRSALYDLIF